MFARRKPPREGTPRQGGKPVTGVHTEVTVVADLDAPALHRDRALRHTIGLGLQGYSGHAVGYDRGDPATSLTGPVAPISSPTEAMAMVGRPADAVNMATTPEFADLPTSDPALDPYMGTLWNRIAR